MKLIRHAMIASTTTIIGATLFAACGGQGGPGPATDITPGLEVNRARAPLGSAIEITYTWTVGPAFEALKGDHAAFVHFVDPAGEVLFADDHVPEPAPSTWESGQTYTYPRTRFIPVYPFVGHVQVQLGLYPSTGSGKRLALKGEDAGLQEYVVGKIELLPQTDNIFLVYKEGWHTPEPQPSDPTVERTWTKKRATLSFKNPQENLILYVEAETNHKAFAEPPVLTISTSHAGISIPIEDSELFLKRIRLPKEALGSEEWVTLELTMSQSFVPKELGLNQDDRELGLLVHNLYLGEEGRLGDELPEVINATVIADVE